MFLQERSSTAGLPSLLKGFATHLQGNGLCLRKVGGLKAFEREKDTVGIMF